MRLLAGPLRWVHGYRFDMLGCIRSGASSEASRLLQAAPAVTWATSNWKGQVALPK